MTQVQTMTNQELNRALAVLMGWKAGGDPNKQRDFVWWIDDHRFRLPEKWEPCTDPAASLEVHTAAMKLDKVAYVKNLLIVMFGQKVYEREFSNHVLDFVHAAKIMDASPRERAEASYLTLKGVREHVD